MDGEWEAFLWLSKRFFWYFFQREKYIRGAPGGGIKESFSGKEFFITDRFHLLFLVFYGIIRADNEKLSKNHTWRPGL